MLWFPPKNENLLRTAFGYRIYIGFITGATFRLSGLRQAGSLGTSDDTLSKQEVVYGGQSCYTLGVQKRTKEVESQEVKSFTDATDKNKYKY